MNDEAKYDAMDIIDNEELQEFYYVKDSGLHGKGLYAKVDIAKGEYMGTYDGPDVTENGMHVLWVEEDDGSTIARDGQNMLRYLNHSPKPHAEFEGFDLFARRSIKKDIEITIDYGEDPAE
jgi:SET domain-containing protein